MNWSDLNLVAQARRYGIPLWQHPQLLFLFMGMIIAAATIFSYLLGRRYIADPYIAALGILILTVVLLVLAFLITRSFERLAEASRLKSEFVSVVSHELRAPLSNTAWALEYLMTGRGGAVLPGQVDYLHILQDNAARMQGLVGDLLMVSRIQEGTVPLKLELVAFPKLLDEVLQDFTHFFKAANIELLVQGDSQMQEIHTDIWQLKHVISNFVDNAIKYTQKSSNATAQEGKDKNKVTVRYSLQKNKLHVEVQDQGVGIPLDDQRHIFQKFFRSQNALRNETQGSGLGLYIAKSIVERLHGTIGFRSQEHTGSTFWFTVPVV
jgi:signal transduction histidine kinase